MSHHDNKIFITGSASKEYQENYDRIFRNEWKEIEAALGRWKKCFEIYNGVTKEE